MKKLTCIICPRGCSILVDDYKNVSGNFCGRGEQYAIEELTHPMRSLTTSIRVNNRENCLVSVKTDRRIPKERMFDLMEEINKISVSAPTEIGQVVLHNPIGIEVDIIITKKVQ